VGDSGHRVLSVVVWAHHMFVSGMNPYFGFFFATTTLIIAVPTAIKVYNWVITLWRGDIHFSVPMLFAIAFISTFVIGGLTGLFLGNVSVDIPLSNTYFVVAHFHGDGRLADPGGVRRHLPLVSEGHGRLLNDTLGRIHFWITFVGTYAIFFPMHYLGILGMPRRYYAWDNYSFIPESAHTMNMYISIAAFIVAAAQLLFVFNLFWSVRRGQPPAPTRGVPPRWNGRRRRRRRCTATGGASARGLSLGLRVQRAGREGGLHCAERAARPVGRTRAAREKGAVA
jgi:cytochrome c oxidase subunit 1